MLCVCLSLKIAIKQTEVCGCSKTECERNPHVLNNFAKTLTVIWTAYYEWDNPLKFDIIKDLVILS